MNKKNLISLFVSIFVITSVVTLGLFLPQTSLKAQSTLSPAQFVELLINIGVISPDKAQAARVSIAILANQKPNTANPPVTAPVVTPINSNYPIMKIGETANGATVSCDTNYVNLAWTELTPASSSVYNNIRVDDETFDGWGNKSEGSDWCQGFDGSGDLCRNGLPANSSFLYPVKEGHNYNFWVQSTDITGASSSVRRINFSVPVCATTVDPDPTITLGLTSDNSTTTCTTTKINLAWTTPTSPAGLVYHNIRVDDKSNSWGGKTGGLGWCSGFDGGGDLCNNGLTSNIRKGFSVTPGHGYRFWVQSTDISGQASTTREINFSVPACATPPARPTIDLKISTSSVSGPYVSGSVTVASGTSAWLRWSTTNASACSLKSNFGEGTRTSSQTVATSSQATSLGSITQHREYELSCNGVGGERSQSLEIDIEDVAEEEEEVSFDTSIDASEIFCNKGDWYGKNSIIGMWLKRDSTYNSDPRFLCHTDRTIYRCTKDADETTSNTAYWNTFSTRIPDGAPTPNYTCSMSTGKWVNK